MEHRSPERIRHHYEVERELAARLKRASRDDRTRLYNDVYNELYSRVPDIPHLAQQADNEFRTGYVASLLPFLRPFPVVRIKGVLTARGARVTLLSVRAPRGSSVTVTCRGSDCPSRRYTSPAATGRLRPFERELGAGTRLEVRVTKAGFIGKSTVFVIRRQAAPKRTDRCLPPGAKRAVRCPAR